MATLRADVDPAAALKLWNAAAEDWRDTPLDDFSDAGWDAIFRDLGGSYLPYLQDNADFFFDTGKRGWTETIREGLLRPEGNELTVTLSSVDGSPAPVGSLIGVQEVSLFYSVTLP